LANGMCIVAHGSCGWDSDWWTIRMSLATGGPGLQMRMVPGG
jgi:hypothetical protein